MIVPGFNRFMSIISLLLISCIHVPAAGLQVEKIKLPPGFSISVFVSGAAGARSLTLGDKGTLFIGTRDYGKVYAVPGATDGDASNSAARGTSQGAVREVITIASGLDMPNGVAFRNGSLYVAEVGRILRFDAIEESLRSPPRPVVVYDRLPRDRAHGWKFIRFGPDGLLYVPIGAPCNVCEPGDPYASIHRLRPDGTGFETYARGIRNTVGFDWDPVTGELWFTDNGRDLLGDNTPPDELNRAPTPGLNFGFPYLHGKSIPDPVFGKKRDASGFTLPEMELGPHVAALGMRFYTGSMFPREYRGQVFIAEHGSWNRSVPIGYRLSLVRIKDNRAVSYETFAEGWLQGGSAWGRPVDVLVMPDGALLVSDDLAGAVYRISWRKP